jgi:molecular chaperone DnaK (HSP70)
MVDAGATHVGLTLARRGRDGRLAVAASKWIEGLSAAELDARVVDLTLHELASQAKEDHRADPAARIRLLDAVERARIDLKRSTVVELKVSLPAPGGASNVGFERSIKLPRSRIYQVTEELVGQICGRVQDLLKESGLHPHALDALVLAGS